MECNFHCRLSELYQGGVFITKQAFQNLIRLRANDQNYILAENSHLLLKNALKYVIKNSGVRDGRKVTFQNSVPLKNPKPPKYSHSDTFSLFMNSRSGSKPFRRILDKEIDFVDKQRVNSWKKTLNCG